MQKFGKFCPENATHGTFDVEISLAKGIIFRKIGLANVAILKPWAAHPCPKFSREPLRGQILLQSNPVFIRLSDQRFHYQSILNKILHNTLHLNTFKKGSVYAHAKALFTFFDFLVMFILNAQQIK